MKLRVLGNCLAIVTIALFSYVSISAQVVDAVRDAAEKTADVTKDAAKKTADVTKAAAEKTVDATKDAAGATKDVTKDAAQAAGSGAKTGGSWTVRLVDNVKDASVDGGRWLVVTTWDGTKWVSKRTWFATKKAAGATRDAVVGDDEKKP